MISSTGQNLRVVLNAAPTATPPVPVGATFTDGDVNGAVATIKSLAGDLKSPARTREEVKGMEKKYN